MNEEFTKYQVLIQDDLVVYIKFRRQHDSYQVS